jgi:ribosomal RNA methyltransferase Nop2
MKGSKGHGGFNSSKASSSKAKGPNKKQQKVESSSESGSSMEDEYEYPDATNNVEDDDDDDEDDEEEEDGDDDDDEDDEDEEEGSQDNGNNDNDGDDDDDENNEESVLLANGERILTNPISVRERIDKALDVLGDFKNRTNKSLSRSGILNKLAKDLSEYYGYIPELSEFLLDLFPPSECVEYMDASDRPRPLVIRTNTLKTTRKDLMDALSKRGATVEPIDWSKVAIKVTESSVPIGATPEYLAGHYMLQSAASLNPVMALDPQPNERILDMSSAPGGKTSYIAQLMKNSGTVIANDLKPERQKATVANLHRMGVKNSIVCCYDGRKVPSIMKGFDRVLLDAPCSGLGVISRDQSVKLQRTVKDIQRMAHLQKELLCAAVDAVDHKSPTGGIIVYSTCSISSEENEQVINYILQKRYVKVINSGLEVGKPGFTRHKERRFHPSLALTRRFYPQVHNMDGFYVAKLQKYAPGVRNDDEDKESQDDENSENYSDSEENNEEEYEFGDDNDDEEEEEEVVVKKSSSKPSKPVETSKPSTQKSSSKPVETSKHVEASKPSTQKSSSKPVEASKPSTQQGKSTANSKVETAAKTKVETSNKKDEKNDSEKAKSTDSMVQDAIKDVIQKYSSPDRALLQKVLSGVDEDEDDEDDADRAPRRAKKRRLSISELRAQAMAKKRGLA